MELNKFYEEQRNNKRIRGDIEKMTDQIYISQENQIL